MAKGEIIEILENYMRYDLFLNSTFKMDSFIKKYKDSENDFKVIEEIERKNR